MVAEAIVEAEAMPMAETEAEAMAILRCLSDDEQVPDNCGTKQRRLVKRECSSRSS